MSRLYDFHGGVHPPSHKELSRDAAIRTLPLPPQLVLTLAQSVGNPARACVAVGQRVLAGQRIADADGRVSSALHAPTSGTVLAVEPRPCAHPSGLPDLAVVIAPDGLHEAAPATPLPGWRETGDAQMRDFLRDMGVVGQGGAVFPSHLKLGAAGLDELVINGAECEPFITCDDRLMRERADGVVAGVAILAHFLRPRAVLIGIEDDKPEAIAAMTAACTGTGFAVVTLPTRYPSGGAKQLIRLLTGKEVPHGVRSTDLGVQCFNVGTAYSIHRAVEHGEPVTRRVVTLTGAVAQPGNVDALLGTPMDWLLEQAGRAGAGRVIVGGPMMGHPQADLTAGLSKACNCLIAADDALLPPRPPAMPCIRCGACADACPAKLQPMDLYWFAKAKNFGKAQEWHLFDCIECGACSYVCPSQLPLVDFYRYAKGEIWAAERERQAAGQARRRHEFRQFRIVRDKEEKAQRLAAHRTPAAAPADDAKAAAIRAAMERAAQQAPQAAAQPATMDDAKRAAIQAAMERAAARKAEADTPPAPAAMDDAKRAAIQAAMERAAALRAEREAQKPSDADPQ